MPILNIDYIAYNTIDASNPNALYNNAMYVGAGVTPSFSQASESHNNGTKGYIWFPTSGLSTKIINGISLNLYKHLCTSYNKSEKNKAKYLNINLYGTNTVDNTIPYNYRGDIQKNVTYISSLAYGGETWNDNSTRNLNISSISSEFQNYKYLLIELGTLSGCYYGTTFAPNNSFISINFNYVVPIVTATFPVNNNIKQNSNNVFTWNVSEQISTGGQKSATIYVTNTATEVIKTYTVGTTQYCTIPANDLEIGQYTWYVRVTNQDNQVGQSAVSSFKVIGETDAPDITSIDNKIMPTIEWSASSQSAYEVRVSSEGNVLYDSGLISGDDDSHTLTKMLYPGTFIAEVKVLNEFGYYTNWASKEFVLNPTQIEAPSNVSVSVTKDYGIEIDGDVTEGADVYIIRRKPDRTEKDIEVIAKVDSLPYIHYKSAANQFYLYTLRQVIDGEYGDGRFTMIDNEIDGVVVYDDRDYTNHVLLNCSDSDFDIAHSEGKEKTFRWCIGRKYPIKEEMDWITTVRSFKAYVSADDFLKLKDIYLNGGQVYYKTSGEAFLADMEIADDGKFITGGRFVNFTFTRILDEEEEN